MSNPTVTWVIAPTSSTAITSVGPTLPDAPASLAISVASRVGQGLVHPFRRDLKGDWVNKFGADMIITHVSQILGTRANSEFGQGELAWRGAFGSRMHLLKHAPITPSTREIARLYCVEALQHWEPRVRLTDVSIESETIDTGVKLTLNVRFNFIDLKTGAVLFEGLRASIVL